MADITLMDSDVIQIAKQSNANMWQDFQFGRPGLYSCYFDDFHQYIAGDWTVTAAGGGTAALATSAPNVGGVLRLTTANADDDLVSLQRVGHAFTPTVGSTIYYETRIQTSEATQQDWVFGLGITDTTPLAITDCIVFQKDDGDTQIDFKEINSSGSTSSDNNIATHAAATYVKLGFKVVGTSYCEYWVNDVKKGSFSTSNIPVVPLRVTMAIQDGDTGAALGALTGSIDYVFVAQSRV